MDRERVGVTGGSWGGYNTVRLLLLAPELYKVGVAVCPVYDLDDHMAGAIEPYLPTAHWLAWIDLYRDPILWSAVREGAAVQAGYVLVAFGAAWANFATKDVTS